MKRNTHVEKIIKSIESELMTILRNNSLAEIKYPIFFENELGFFELRENNSLLVKSKKGAEYLVLNINIMSTYGNS